MRTAFALAVATVALGCGPRPGPNLPTAGSVDPDAANRPYVVDWPGRERVRLSSLVRVAQKERTLLVVRYGDNKLDVLPYCRAPGAYTYAPGDSASLGRDLIENVDRLRTSLPLGAAQFGAAIARGDVLAVRTAVAGEYRSNKGNFTLGELSGDDCEGSTHIVTAVSVGAFDLHAGARSDIEAHVKAFGVGVEGGSSNVRERLNFGGDVPMCRTASGGDVEPPRGCGSPIGLELAAIRPGAVSSRPPAAARRDEVDRAVGRELPTEPLLVGFPAETQAAFSYGRREGIVVVRMAPGEFRQLPGCSAEGSYDHIGVSPKQQVLIAIDPDELVGQFSVAAPKFEQALRRAGGVTVRLWMVGVSRTTRQSASVSELRGPCAGATHFVQSYSVGAYELREGRDLDTKGPVLSISGDPEACKRASPDASAPPPTCSAPLRVSLRPLDR